MALYDIYHGKGQHDTEEMSGIVGLRLPTQPGGKGWEKWRNHHAGPNAILLFYKTEEEMKAAMNKDCDLLLYKGGSKLLEIWDSQLSLPLLTLCLSWDNGCN